MTAARKTRAQQVLEKIVGAVEVTLFVYANKKSLSIYLYAVNQRPDHASLLGRYGALTKPN
jgi:hypothetical protein